MHYSKEVPSCSTFRVIKINFWVSEILGFLWYLQKFRGLQYFNLHEFSERNQYENVKILTSSPITRLQKIFFHKENKYNYAPQLRRSWRGILVSGCVCMRPSVQEPCKLGFWSFMYGFLMEKYLTCFFLVRVISLFGVMPPWKSPNEIWCMPYLLNRLC